MTAVVTILRIYGFPPLPPPLPGRAVHADLQIKLPPEYSIADTQYCTSACMCNTGVCVILKYPCIHVSAIPLMCKYP